MLLFMLPGSGTTLSAVLPKSTIDDEITSRYINPDAAALLLNFLHFNFRAIGICPQEHSSAISMAGIFLVFRALAEITRFPLPVYPLPCHLTHSTVVVLTCNSQEMHFLTALIALVGHA